MKPGLFQFWDTPTTHTWTRQQEPDFRQSLVDTDDATTSSPIVRAEEVQLGTDGRTKEGSCRYTNSSFFSMARFMAKGLAHLVADLLGMIRSSDNRENYADPRMAVQLWNRTAELRLPLLRRCRLLRNVEMKTIDGVLGGTVTYRGNSEFYCGASEIIGKIRPSMVFYAGVVRGRRLACWFRDDTVVARLPDGEPVRLGLFLAQASASGWTARFTGALYTKHGVSLVPYTKGLSKVLHVGKDALPRILTGLCDRVSKLPSHSWLRDRIAVAADSLGLGHVAEANRKRADGLRRALMFGGVPQPLAILVVNSLGSHSPTAADMWADHRRDYAGLTVLDLYAALLLVARRTDFGQRERLEQAAFSLLTGSLQL